MADAREGQLLESEAKLRDVIHSDPFHAPAHHNLAVALVEQGKNAEAIENFRRAIEYRPGYISAHLNLAGVLSTAGQKYDAIDHYRRVLELQPDSAAALNGLGLVMTEVGRPGEAAVCLKQAIRLQPEMAEAHNNLGLALADLANFPGAEAAFDQALRLDPRSTEAHTNLGTTYGQQARFQEALASYQVALWLHPDSVSTHWNRSLAWLSQGNYEQGWHEYEWRWRRKKSPMRPFDKPQWDGSSLEGRTILLWNEQGLGDTLQFVRYAQVVKQRGGRVIAEMPAPLAKILPSSAGVDEFYPEGAELPSFDAHVPLMGLPLRCGTTLSTIPNRVPYLTADPHRIEAWGPILAELTGLRVGIAWQGNPNHQWDRYRSVPLSALLPLNEIPGVNLISLQRGPGSEQLQPFSALPPIVVPIDPKLDAAEAFAETAALMMHLDLVITVDTAIAHLAGALNVPTWIALSKISDWRWLVDRSDSPWYPNVQLFRQHELGDWKSVFEAMAKILRSSGGFCGETSVRKSESTTIVKTPGARRSSVAVVTLVTTPEYDQLAGVTLPSQRDYATRINADFVLLNGQVYPHPHYDKWQIYDLLEVYDRVLFLDADVIVRPDCPDLFAMVPTDCFAGENELQSFPGQANHLSEFLNAVGLAQLPCPFYVNAGVMVASREHRHVFRPPEMIVSGVAWPEQSHLNARLIGENVPIHLLPPSFNDRHREGEYLRQSFILHYSCMQVDQRIESAKRDLLGWRRLFRRE